MARKQTAIPRFKERGVLLQAARKKLGLSQKTFALALGVKLSRLQKWERGTTEPYLKHSEMQRFKQLNAEIFDAWIDGDVSALRVSSSGFRRGTPPVQRTGPRSGGRGEGKGNIPGPGRLKRCLSTGTFGELTRGG